MKSFTTISMVAAVTVGFGAMAGAASAQSTAQPPQPMTQSVAQASDPTQATPDTAAPAPAAAATAVPEQVQTPPAGATVVANTVTNGPIPDTPANRAKYGAPMSHTGKKTSPSGN
jgi:hypothetical protein